MSTVTCLQLQKNMWYNKNCKKIIVLVTMTATCNLQQWWRQWWRWRATRTTMATTTVTMATTTMTAIATVLLTFQWWGAPPLDLKHVGAVGMLITSLVALPPGAKASPLSWVWMDFVGGSLVVRQ
jgi:hypothetical protein